MLDVQGTYDIKKLNKLKKEITDKQDELFKEISVALGNGDNDTYNCLKQLQLQCSAELRLISHIENGMKGDFMIC